jgi:predicted nucleotidyltransferase
MKQVNHWLQSHPHDAALLARCRDIVQEVAPGAVVILYGSRARDAAGPESDYDLLILVEGTLSRQLEEQIGDRLYALELESGAVLSLLFYEKRAWDSPLCKATPLHRNVDQEGIML